MKRPCIVVFPLYKVPTDVELHFLENGNRKLSNYDQVIVCPENLKITPAFGKLSKLPKVRFSNHYFESIDGYNRLMLLPEFYSAFSNYEYILIHQPDVYVFKDELQYWCSKNYAYIGAPWLRKNDSLLKKCLIFMRKFIQPNYGNKHNKVGNGGFSLRNVSDFLEILKLTPQSTMNRFCSKSHHLFNEDVFWSLIAPKINPFFKIPYYKDALSFGIEFQPEKALKMNNGQLPFGCHAPIVHGLNFWKKYIPILNNDYLTLVDETRS